jgi:hypothetical protein
VSTCAHGLPAGQCLICATLATTATEDPRADRRAAIPAGAAQVIPQPGRAAGRAPGTRGGRSRRRVAPRLVGGLLALVVVALLGWWILGLVWAVLRLVELVAIGVGCGYLGYRVGVISGRHQAHHDDKHHDDKHHDDKVRR